MHILEYENYEETKKHYDTDFSYNTYPCSIPLDFPCVPMHWHRETEIIYVKSGRGMVNVDGISYPVVKDSIVFILPAGFIPLRSMNRKHFHTKISFLICRC